MQELILLALGHAGASLALLFTLNVVLIASVIVLENRAPERAHGWLLVLFAFPLIGFILYLFFGHNWHRKSKRARVKAFENMKRWREEAKKDLALLANRSHAERHLRYLTTTVTGLRPTNGNKLHILTDAQIAYPDIIHALKSAKKCIDLEFYIFRYDDFGKEIIEILKERSKNGIRVRLLVDGYGSIGFGAKAFRDLRQAGVYAQYFAPLITFFYFFKANYRDHRKMIVIDDEIAYTGGMNIGNEYLGRADHGHWRDTMIRIEGPAVRQMHTLFESSWRRSTKKAHSELYPRQEISPADSGGIVSLIPSGPDTEWFAIQRVYLELIHGAEKRIIIQTPYFVPDSSIQEALINAALRGIDVQILIPKKPDHPIFRWIAMTYFGDLLRAGARIFEYQPGFLHQKVMIADDDLATIGTCNIDIRSFRLDFEVNLLLSDTQAIQHLLEDVRMDIEQSHELDHEQYLKRSFPVRILESLARLIAPLV